jgi:nucleoside-diphosphate-sugar epimerase
MVLVTGGTGLLGSHLLYDLLIQGRKVRAIRRTGSHINMVQKVFSYYHDNPGELAGRIEWVTADLLDPGSLEDAMEGITEVYHAGAIVSFRSGDKAKLLNVNVEGTANLVNLALLKGIEKFCHVSSIATLGRTAGQEVSTEETWWVPSRKNSVYSLSKYSAEREVWRGMEEGLNAVIVNPSVILGPGFWQGNSGLFRLVDKGLKFFTRGTNGYVDVRDVSLAMIRLMDGNHFGHRYICSAGNFSYQAIFSLMAKHLDRKAPGIYISPLMASLAWRAETVRALVTGTKPEITREMAITASQTYAYSSEKLCKTLNFEFRDVEETVREICRYYRNYKIPIDS